jgi:hypothetical protein
MPLSQGLADAVPAHSTTSAPHLHVVKQRCSLPSEHANVGGGYRTLPRPSPRNVEGRRHARAQLRLACGMWRHKVGAERLSTNVVTPIRAEYRDCEDP